MGSKLRIPIPPRIEGIIKSDPTGLWSRGVTPIDVMGFSFLDSRLKIERPEIDLKMSNFIWFVKIYIYLSYRLGNIMYKIDYRWVLTYQWQFFHSHLPWDWCPQKTLHLIQGRNHTAAQRLRTIRDAFPAWNLYILIT